MGKYDYIIELSGADDYPSWRHAVTLALQGDGLWNHCSIGTDPNNYAELASVMPSPAIAGSPTDVEKQSMITWIKEDAQAKGIICRKLSAIIQGLLSENWTAREQWNTLATHFGRLDVTSQFKLRAQLFAEKLKDPDDAPRYISTFENARRRFAEMAVVVTKDEMVFLLLHGLPLSPEWLIFKCMTMNLYSTLTPSSSSTTTKKMTFANIVTSLSEEANRLRGELKLNGPGSEYANATSFRASEAKTNLKTGIRIHKANPKGISCDNPVCTGLLRSLTHDRKHCFQSGGGMEGQGGVRNRERKPGSRKPEVAAAANSTDTSPSSPITPSVSNAAVSNELSCAMIEEFPLEPESSPTFDDIACIAQQTLSTILDSGTTSNLIMDRSYFWTYSESTRVMVKTANHGRLPTSGRGNCIADLTLGARTFRVTFTNCLHAPGAMINLLSVGHMLRKKWSCNFEHSPARCQLKYHGETLSEIPMTGNLFFVDVKFIRPTEPSSHSSTLPHEISSFAHTPLSWNLWHARMGHPGGDSIKRISSAATGVKVDSSEPLHKCESCIIAKHPRRPFRPSETPRASHMLDLVHSDLCGPFPVSTPHGKLHFIVFLDDHTNLLNVQLLATKDQALDAWRIIKARWENHLGCTVKVFRSDNGGEFISGAFTKDLLAAGIERQLSAPYAHQQNGKAERAIRTLEGHLFSMLESANLPANLWGEAALTACYLWNRTTSTTLPPNTTPFELVNGRKPDLSHIRVFGSRCFARIPAELQVKLGPHSRKAIFLGYPDGTKGYRLRDTASGAFFIARDVIFNERITDEASDSESETGDEVPVTHTQAPTAVLPQPPTLSRLTAPPHPSASVDPPLRRSACAKMPTAAGNAWAADIAAAKARLQSLRESRTACTQVVPSSEGVVEAEETVDVEEENLEEIEPNSDVPDAYANTLIEEHANITIRSDRKRDPNDPSYDMKIPPSTYDEAMLRTDRNEWLEAMKKELNIMDDMHVYQLAPLPDGCKAIGNRWVLEFKEDNKGGSVYKARLVTQGFSQIPGVDYGATFAPVLKTASLCLIAALACKNDWELHSFDATRAFLWGVLKEEIYMRQPRGFEKGDWKVQVWRMLRTIYGLKQSAMEWYKQVREVMNELGFARCPVDYAVFLFDSSASGTRIICIIGFHVDDGMGTSNSPAFLIWVKQKIHQRFGIKDMGPVTKFIGIQFERDRNSRQLWMHQGEYITYLLEEYNLLDCNPVRLPLDSHHPFGKPDDVHATIPNLPTQFRKLIGELLYLAICTRPDISFAVNSLAQHNSKPLPSHYAAAKRLLRYLSGTINLRLHYGGGNANDGLYAYCDADWASCPADRLSISGYVWFYAGGIIAHVSKKQTTHALSSTEAEYMAVTHVIQEGLWIKSLIVSLHIPLPFPIMIYMDNTGAISLSTEARNHICSKHIDVRYHFIREHIERGTFLLKWLPSHKNTADIFTKALPRPLFEKHLPGLQLVSR